MSMCKKLSKRLSNVPRDVIELNVYIACGVLCMAVITGLIDIFSPIHCVTIWLLVTAFGLWLFRFFAVRLAALCEKITNYVIQNAEGIEIEEDKPYTYNEPTQSRMVYKTYLPEEELNKINEEWKIETHA